MWSPSLHNDSILPLTEHVRIVHMVTPLYYLDPWTRRGHVKAVYLTQWNQDMPKNEWQSTRWTRLSQGPVYRLRICQSLTLLPRGAVFRQWYVLSRVGSYQEYLSLADVTSARCWVKRPHIKYFGDPSPTLAQARSTSAHKHHLLFLSSSLFSPRPQNHLPTGNYVLNIIIKFSCESIRLPSLQTSH